MRKPILGLLTAAVAALALFSGSARAADYEIDPNHLTVAFKVNHVGYFDVIGLFTRGSGTFTFDEGSLALSDVKIVIETRSVFTGQKARDKHLRSADFLNAGEFPEMVFVGKSAEKTGAKTGKVHGELTLLGVTRPLTLDVRWNKAAMHPIYKKYTLGVEATGTVKRSDFGMNYAISNGWIGDEIHLMIGFEAQRL